MDLIVLADSDGIVDITHEALARITNRPVDVIKQTIAVLEGPDPKSRTPDHNGARLKRLDEHRDWGWVILNFTRFRGIVSDSQYREKNRLRAQKFREKHPYQPKCNPSTNVTNNVTRNVTDNATSFSSRYSNATPASASASESKGGGTGGGCSNGVSPSAQAVLHSKELERVEQRIKDVKDMGSRVAGGQVNFTAPQRAELRVLKERREELKRALGFLA